MIKVDINKTRPFLWLCLLLALEGCVSKRSTGKFDNVCAVSNPGHKAVVPLARTARPGWIDRHQHIVNQLKEGRVDLLFIGDSITQRWEKQGTRAWNTNFSSLFAVNAGIDGDCTEHVLWRLDNGLLDVINPKLVVLLIGSNHVNNYEAEEIIDGIKAIACSIRTKLPDTKLLLVGVLPRGTASPAGAYRLAKASEGASKIADNRTIHYLDVAERFFDKNGNVSLELMTEDRVHLSEAGYFTLADALRPTIVDLMSK